MLTNAHLKARDMMVEIDHPEYGPMTLPGCPVKVSDGAITFTAAPLLGADNAAVYGKLLGLDAKRLQELQAQGVI
jgi:crotonobetainyl-CoA:carnitine CoA-transferase CaiB-like acyl-CoA transferase